MLDKQFKSEKKKIRKSLANLHGVVGVGFGLQEKNGKRTGQRVVRVYVEQKAAPGDLGKGNLVPKFVRLSDGTKVPTDVVAVGKIEFRGYTGKYRPSKPGAVVGHFQGNFAGTLGAVATDNTDGKKVFISASHVLANENLGSPGDNILQPASQYGGVNPADKIGTLKRFVPLQFGPGGVNFVDAAIAKPTPGSGVKARPFCSPVNHKKQGAVGLLFAGSPVITIINPMDRVVADLDVTLRGPMHQAALGMDIHACTAVSGYIQTTVTDIHVDLTMNFNGNPVLWKDQIITAGGIANSSAGDSGAVFYTQFNV